MIAGVVQMTSDGDVGANLERAARGIARAAERGARLIALPENFCQLREPRAPQPNPDAQDLDDGPVVRFLADQAKRHGVWLAGGTIPERIPGDTRVYNTALCHDPEGRRVGVYRKIHLFDVELADVSLRESESVAPGEGLTVVDTPLGGLGLSVCYDLRFPELYRELVARGARLLSVPAAFTVPTGQDHWEVLLRARAIENQCFVVAAAQWGVHNAARRSYGRSMIVDPWGTVLCCVGDGEGVATAELDLARLEDVRARLPALGHRRLGL